MAESKPSSGMNILAVVETRPFQEVELFRSWFLPLFLITLPLNQAPMHRHNPGGQGLSWSPGTLGIWLVLILAPAGLKAQDRFRLPNRDISAASRLFDLRFSPAQQDSMQDGLRENHRTFEYEHRLRIPNSRELPLYFNPALPGMRIPRIQRPIYWVLPRKVELPKNPRDLAYYSIKQLASLLREKKISSVELTRFFLARLKKYGPILHCVVSLTQDIALREARRADSDFARGIDRSLVQGIPYGVKDLFAVKRTPTTWGSPPYRDQVIDQTAYPVQKLRQAGAVLVAKLSLGELAMNDIWFGGLTRNPWDTAQGSSGSSAGPASATVAGLVPFSLGTETYGSIVAPSMTCGATGLRPSFGRVSRSGAMTLAWTSDKVGPICRSAEDAAIVFNIIRGTDGLDPSARDLPFNYREHINLSDLKIAYARNFIDTLPAGSTVKRALEVFRRLGARLIPVDFPDTFHSDQVLNLIVGAESAAAFDHLTRSGRDSLMVLQDRNSWPNLFRVSRFIPAVEYLNAQRIRRHIMEQFDPFMEAFDIVIVPSFAGSQLSLTNLCGQPVLSLPTGPRKNGLPSGITLIGNLYREATLLEAAKQYQLATVYGNLHPLWLER